jgi:GNAT superfamily N-acetyltransferase
MFQNNQHTLQDREKLVEFVSFGEKQDSLIIVAVGVRPEYQGFGVGKNLIKRAESEARIAEVGGLNFK